MREKWKQMKSTHQLIQHTKIAVMSGSWITAVTSHPAGIIWTVSHESFYNVPAHFRTNSWSKRISQEMTNPLFSLCWPVSDFSKFLVNPRQSRQTAAPCVLSWRTGIPPVAATRPVVWSSSSLQFAFLPKLIKFFSTKLFWQEERLHKILNTRARNAVFWSSEEVFFFWVIFQTPARTQKRCE